MPQNSLARQIFTRSAATNNGIKKIWRSISSFIYRGSPTCTVSAKGQLISEWNFGVFKSPKKSTKFLTDFCPSFILCHKKSVNRIGQTLLTLSKAQNLKHQLAGKSGGKFIRINWVDSITTQLVRTFKSTKNHIKQRPPALFNKTALQF